MKFLNTIFVLLLVIGGTPYTFAQGANTKNHKIWLVSEAYAVLVKEKAKAKGNLYEAEQMFTAQTIQVKAAALRLTLLNRELKKLSRTSARSAVKFSAAYGDLLLTKIQYEVELYELRQKFTPESIVIKKKEIQLASLNGDLRQISKGFH